MFFVSWNGKWHPGLDKNYTTCGRGLFHGSMDNEHMIVFTFW